MNATTAAHETKDFRHVQDSKGISVTIRKPDFAWRESGKYWFANNPVLTWFMYALSILFPEGERFFMDSVRHYSPKIKDPELNKQVAGFLGQEALHGREHEEYNDRLKTIGVSPEKMESLLLKLLNLGRRILPRSSQLAVTVALEHYTAIMAEMILKDDTVTNAMEKGHAQIWRWHAIEETEHKGVAWDVYTSVGGGYVNRVLIMLMVTAIFWPVVFSVHLYFVAKDGRLLDFRGWWQAAKFVWKTRRPVLATVIAYFDYFRPGFHPWQRGGSDLIAAFDAQYAAA